MSEMYAVSETNSNISICNSSKQCPILIILAQTLPGIYKLGNQMLVYLLIRWYKKIYQLLTA